MSENSEQMIPSGMPMAEVIARLYNASKPLGMGMMHYTPKPLTAEEVEPLLEGKDDAYFDYLNGRVMKVSTEALRKNDARALALYDRDNGPGAGLRAIWGSSAEATSAAQ